LIRLENVIFRLIYILAFAACHALIMLHNTLFALLHAVVAALFKLFFPLEGRAYLLVHSHAVFKPLTIFLVDMCLLVQAVDFRKYVQFALVVLYLSLGEEVYCVIVSGQLVSLEELNSCLVELQDSNLMEKL